MTKKEAIEALARITDITTLTCEEIGIMLNVTPCRVSQVFKGKKNKPYRTREKIRSSITKLKSMMNK